MAMSYYRPPRKDIPKWAKQASQMPPLCKTPFGEYRFEADEVMRWIATQPDIMTMAFSRMQSSGAIIYDPDTGMWRGVNYKGV